MDELLQGYIDKVAFAEDTKFGVEQLGQLEAAFDRLKGIKVSLQGSSDFKSIAAAANESKTAIQDLKVKNLELTAAIKEQQLAIKANAEERRKAAADQKLADQQAKANIAQRIADEKAAADAAELASREKIRAMSLQAQAEKELAELQKDNGADVGIYDTTGQKGGAKVIGPASSAAAQASVYAPINQQEASLLYLSQTEALLKENQLAQKALDDQLAKGSITQAQYDEAIIAAKQEEIAYRANIQATNAELKARQALNESAVGSIDAARAQNKLLIAQRNAIPVGEGASPEDIEKVKALNAEIDRNNELIDKNNDLLGRQKINIGNYPTALGATFKTLNTELDSVQGKLVNGNFGGKEFDQLTAKQAVLQNALSLSGKSFATSAAEATAYKEAAIQIGSVYGKNSDIFKQFAAGVQQGAIQTKALANEVSGTVSKGKGLSKMLTSTYNSLRKIAYAIPGVGIGGLILILLAPLQALAAEIVNYYKKVDEAKVRVQALNEVNEAAVKIFNKEETDVQALSAVVADNTISLKNRKTALDELIAINPDYLRGLTLENIATDEGRKILDNYFTSLEKTGELKASLAVSEQSRQALADLQAEKAALEALAKAGKVTYSDLSDAQQKFVPISAAHGFRVTAEILGTTISKSDISKILAGMDKGIADATTKVNVSLGIYKDKFKENLTSGDGSVKGIIETIQGKISTLQKIQPTLISEDAIKKNVAEIKKLQDELDKLLGKKTSGSKGHAESESIADQYRKKALKAQQDYIKSLNEQELAGYKTIADDQLASLDDRLAAEKSYYEKSVSITKQSIQDQIDAVNLEADLSEKRAAKINDPKKRADAEIAIADYRTKSIKKINEIGNSALLKDDQDYYSATVKISNEAFDKIKKDAEDATKFIVEQQKIAFQNKKDSIDIETDKKLIDLEKNTQRKSLADITDYNNKKQAILQESEDEKNQLDLERIQQEEAVIEALYGVKNFSLIKQAKDLELKITESTNAKILASETELETRKKALRDQALTSLSDFIHAAYDKQKAANQKEQTDLDASTQRQIDLENSTADSAQQKANKIALINERAAIQKKQLDDKQIAQDRKIAEFDKAMSILKISINTFETVAKIKAEALLLLSNPLTAYYAPFSLAQIPFVLATSALEIGSILATPLPKYKGGKNDNYEGPAIVGDGGVPEFIKREDGTIEKTPATDTLTHLGAGDIVYPDYMSFLRSISMPQVNFAPARENISDIKEAVDRQTKTLKPILSQIANKKELQLRSSAGGMEAIWKWGSRQSKYLEENTNWQS